MSTIDGDGADTIVAVRVLGVGVEAVQRRRARLDIGARFHYLDGKDCEAVWVVCLHVGFGWR